MTNELRLRVDRILQTLDSKVQLTSFSQWADAVRESYRKCCQYEREMAGGSASPTRKFRVDYQYQILSTHLARLEETLGLKPIHASAPTAPPHPTPRVVFLDKKR